MTARRALKLVSPDLAQMEAVVVEAAEQQFPVANRHSTLRGKMTAELRELSNEKAELTDRKLLLQRQCEAAVAALDQQLDDIEESCVLLMRGLQPLDLRETEE